MTKKVLKEDAIQTSSSISINGLPTGNTPDLSKKIKPSNVITKNKTNKYKVYKGINVIK